MTITKKELLIILLIGVLAIALLSWSFTKASEPTFTKEHVGLKVNIEWLEVNVRTGHSTSNEVIATLKKGNSVTLTGYSFDYIGGNSKATECWVEIEMENGTTGWIVRNSIDWLSWKEKCGYVQ